jgi:hypothetical protein
MERSDEGTPRDSDPSDMTDFEKNVAHGELEQIEEEENGGTRSNGDGRGRRDRSE